MNIGLIKQFTINKVILIFIFFILCSNLNVSAHPASEMDISYTLNNQRLSVMITHFVSNPQNHYIDNVTISINNEIIHIFNYTSQPTNSSFTYTYQINATLADEIEVYTHCNLGGLLTKKVTVSTDNSKDDDLGFTIQELSYYPLFGLPFIVYLGLITLGLFLITASLPILKRKKILNVSVKWHIWIAYVAIVFALIHTILGLLVYF